MTKSLVLPLKEFIKLVHTAKNPLQFGDDMTIKPIPYGIIIIDTFAGYETTVTAPEIGDDYTVKDNDGLTPYQWSSEGFIDIYEEDDGFFGFVFEV